MSYAKGQVRFQDGTLRHCIYRGTPDVMGNPFFETEEAVDLEALETTCNCRGAEPVELATNYGGGLHWEGTACRNCRAVVANRMPYEDLEDGPSEGLPEWWQATSWEKTRDAG